MTELRHGLRLDLADSFAGHAVDLTNLVEGLGLTVGHAETHCDDTGFTLGEGVEDGVELLLQKGEGHRVCGDDCLGVLDEVTEFGVAVFAEGGVQGDGLAAVLLNLDDLFGGHVEFLTELLGGGFATEVLKHLALHAGELVDDLDHVHGDADGAGLVCHGAGDGLADPPGCVGGELEALRVVELLDGADKAEVTFLDEVEEEHAAAGVALGEGDDESQVGFEQVVLGSLAVVDDPAHGLLEVLVHVGVFGELVFCVEAGLDAHGEVDFLLCVEQGDLTNLLEVVLDGVGGCAGGDDTLSGGIVVVAGGENKARALGCYSLGGLLFFLLGDGGFVFFSLFVGVGGFEIVVEFEVEVVVGLLASSASLALGGCLSGGLAGALGLFRGGCGGGVFCGGFLGCLGGGLGCLSSLSSLGCLGGAGGLGGGFFGCVAGCSLLAGCRCH